jgi:hypothetical protein
MDIQRLNSAVTKCNASPQGSLALMMTYETDAFKEKNGVKPPLRKDAQILKSGKVDSFS